MPRPLERYIEKLEQKRDLSAEDTRVCVSSMAHASGEEIRTDMPRFLSALNEKGITPQELIRFVQAIRAGKSPMRVRISKPVFDLCGTGGTGLKKFNVSTTAAFVAASAGVAVVKHCGRGSRGSSGSIDFLEALGCPLVEKTLHVHDCAKAVGICFVGAPSYYPLFHKASLARMSFTERSIFNLAGPLLNPFQLEGRVLGVSSRQDAEIIARALLTLRGPRTLIVTGTIGDRDIDELSISGPTELHDVFPSIAYVHHQTVWPKELDIKSVHYSSIPKGDAETNATLFQDLIEQHEKGPLRDLVALNAGALLYVAGKALTIKHGFEAARELIAQGEVKKTFEKYRAWCSRAGLG